MDGLDLAALGTPMTATGARVGRLWRPEASAHYPWILIGLLWGVAFFNAADRSVVFAVMPRLRTEFWLTETELALISSAFFWIYAVSAFFLGRLGDRQSRASVITWGLLFWSIATGVASCATGLITFISLRGVVAIGESTYYPAATALISDWHPPAQRSRALSLHQTAVFAGSGLGAMLAGLVADRFGWRVPFVLFGGAGLLMCLLLRGCLRDVPAHARPIAAPGTGHSEELTVSGPFRSVLASKPALFLCAVFFLATGAATGVTVWAPTYVHDALHLNLADSAYYGSASINGAGFLAVPFGGILSDWLARRTLIGRFYAMIIGLTVAATLLLPLLLARTAAAVGLVLIMSTIGKGLFDGCIYAALHDVVPPAARGTAVGMMTMLGFLGAGLAPILVAKAAASLGMAVGITSLAALYFVAVGILWVTRAVTRRMVVATRQLEEGFNHG